MPVGGGVLVEGRELSGDALRDELFKLAEVKRDLYHPDAPSEIRIELVCDART